MIERRVISDQKTLYLCLFEDISIKQIQRTLSTKNVSEMTVTFWEDVPERNLSPYERIEILVLNPFIEVILLETLQHLQKITLENITFDGVHFYMPEMYKFKFLNIVFLECTFHLTTFNDCTFRECSFIECQGRYKIK